MKIQKLLLAILTISMLSSCNESAKTEEAKAPAEETKTEAVVEKNEDKLALNEGEKWAANPETTTGVNEMIDMTSSFADHGDITSYGHLVGDLEHEFQMIFKNCTMKGEAHNQLHHFLVPLKGLIEDMKSDNLETNQKALADIQAHLKQFDKFFE